MYVPQHFQQTDRAAIFEFMEAHSFATVITRHGDEPLASHLPLLVDRTAGEHGTLVGHLARANPQAVDAAGQRALVVFGPVHAYISPRWYAEPNTVPTWNYATVHAYGRWEVLDDEAIKRKIVADTTTFNERHLPQPWSIDEAGPVVDALLPQIVGFRIVIERIDAKWKLNQNHSQARRDRVVAALETRHDYDSQSIAALMRNHP